MNDSDSSIKHLIRRRILILDGGLGTMIQACGLDESDYRGNVFTQGNIPLTGCNDVLVLTSPDTIYRIHEAYLAAGADIITTDTFNANAISLRDYGLQDCAYEINLAAARLARSAADAFTAKDAGKPRFVGGSIGPTSFSASISSDVSDPAARAVTFDGLVSAYTEQIGGLIDGGADLIMLETVFDTLNAKAAIFAVKSESARRGYDIPLTVSGTLADASGRILSGQTVEAFYASVAHAEPLAVGFNCSYGAEQLMPYLSRLNMISEFPVMAYPNAGLPNIEGGYDETPESMADAIGDYMGKGLVNIVGGCCGSTPSHIAAIARAAERYNPRPVREKRRMTVLSGLEPLTVSPDVDFINIGERANVAGSAKFARLVRENRFDEAVGIARLQVENGAQMVDVCMDDGMIDGAAAMRRFLNLAMSEPEICRVPFMIDSSSWEVIEEGLKCTQGKSLVNSISLKEGEEEFLRRAGLIRKYGAAAVVMLFDEKGQADTLERKVEIAGRAYHLLTASGFPAEDIIFDPNVLAIATGIEQHNNHAVDFFEACRWIKRNLPHARISGGVSNLSFAFRGIDTVRQAMHSVFLRHATEAGMDMGIVNPATVRPYTEIDGELLELAEDAVLNRRHDATERLSAYAETVKNKDSGKSVADSSAEQWRSGTPQERMAYAMTKGITEYMEEDVAEAAAATDNPLGIIDEVLMPAMTRVGELFGEGRMFLPQVVKSARVMKKAVEALTPLIDKSDSAAGSGNAGDNGVRETVSAKKILVATVKGDVHDIGKNIASVVMSCNGYGVIDLGVMVDSGRIADEAGRTGADAIGLSGLISPSLDEMIRVVGELEKRGLKIPVIIAGAATSALHTAVRIAPRYSAPVIHSRNASDNVAILGKLFGKERENYLSELMYEQERLRKQFSGSLAEDRYVSLETARSRRYVKPAGDITIPRMQGIREFEDYPISEVRKYIDWNYFFPAWDIKGHYPEILDSPRKGKEARKLMADAESLLAEIENRGFLRLMGAAGVFPALSEGDDIVILRDGHAPLRLAQLRNQESGAEYNLSLADYVADGGKGRIDYVGAFAVTAGAGLDELVAGYRAAGDDYSAIMAKLLADRLTEAFAEAVHACVRREMWGYENTSEMTPAEIIAGKYRGIRVAFGYPACPDHSLKREVIELLDARRIAGMTLTENYMIRPAESLCGLMFAGEKEKYFSVGRIDGEQLSDYALRRGMEAGEIGRLIPQHLTYK